MTQQEAKLSMNPGGRNVLSSALLLIWRKRVIIIFSLCLIVYLLYRFLDIQVLFFDEREYLTLAKNLIATGVYGYEPGIPTASRPPGYIVFILPVVLFGFGKSGIVFVQILLWGASIYLVGLISFCLRGPKAAALAMLLAAAYPLCVAVTLTVYPQTLTAFLVLLFMWVLLKDGLQKIDTKKSIGLGIIIGLSILVTPILLPVFFGTLFLLPVISLRHFRSLIIAVFISFCVAGPWLVRNWVVMGTPSISTIVGFNLIYANSENASPELGTAVNIEKYSSAVRGLNEVQTDRAFRNFALKWMYDHPVAATKLYIRKFIQFFGYREVLKTQIAGTEIFQDIVAAAYYPLLCFAIIGVLFFVVTGGGCGEKTIALFYVIAAAFHAVFLQRLRYRAEVDFLLPILVANFLIAIMARDQIFRRRSETKSLATQA